MFHTQVYHTHNRTTVPPTTHTRVLTHPSSPGLKSDVAPPGQEQVLLPLSSFVTCEHTRGGAALKGPLVKLVTACVCMHASACGSVRLRYRRARAAPHVETAVYASTICASNRQSAQAKVDKYSAGELRRGAQQGYSEERGQEPGGGVWWGTRSAGGV